MADFRSSPMIHERRSPRRRSKLEHCSWDGWERKGSRSVEISWREVSLVPRPLSPTPTSWIRLLGKFLSRCLFMCADCGVAVGWHCIGIWEEAAARHRRRHGSRAARVSRGSDPAAGGGGVEGKKGRFARARRAKERGAAQRAIQISEQSSDSLLSSPLRYAGCISLLRPPLWSESAVTVPFAEPFSTNRAPPPV